MIYANGDLIKVGDTVHLGGDQSGIIVGIIGESIYADGYCETDWKYLGHGLVISTDFGDLRLDGPDEDLALVARVEPKLRRSR